MTSKLDDIKELNRDILSCMEHIEQKKPEDESISELVLNLHNLVERRQIILNVLTSTPSFTDREWFEQQFDVTLALIKQSTRILDFRHSLVQVGIKTKRQINVYKAIDSDR